jgi:hypothetical protein
VSEFASDRARRREELVDLASRYADKVRDQYGPATVLLYGSIARGDFNLWSDVDVLVVSDALPLHPLARSEALQRLVLPGIEPKGLTLREYQDAEARDRPFVREIAKHCIVLRDDLGLAVNLRSAE